MVVEEATAAATAEAVSSLTVILNFFAAICRSPPPIEPSVVSPLSKDDSDWCFALCLLRAASDINVRNFALRLFISLSASSISVCSELKSALRCWVLVDTVVFLNSDGLMLSRGMLWSTMDTFLFGDEILKAIRLDFIFMASFTKGK